MQPDGCNRVAELGITETTEFCGLAARQEDLAEFFEVLASGPLPRGGGSDPQNPHKEGVAARLTRRLIGNPGFARRLALRNP